jgi:predicted AAA+ superfamily ATPase
MREIIRTILLDWQERQPPVVKKRDVPIEKYLDTKQAIVVKGFRRVGKTYLLFYLVRKLLETYSKKQVIYINFEDERIPVKKEFLSQLLPVIKEFTGGTPIYLFLDEVQAMPEWSRWLRRLLDTENIKIFITGSSSKISEREIPTELRGRFLEVELLPLSFSEFLRFTGIPEISKDLSEDQKAIYLHNYNEYIEMGGMPEVVMAEKGLKKEIILNYYNVLLRRDIIEKYRIKNEEVLKDLMKLLLNSTHFTGTRLFNNIKSLGHKVGKATILKYASYIRDSFFMDEIYEYSPKVKNQLQRERKIYFIDNAFIGLLNPRIQSMEGKLFEHSVYWELRRKYKHADIYYAREEKGVEVDFVLLGDEKKLIQVSYNLDQASTREREFKALLRIGKKLGFQNSTIITYDTQKTEHTEWFGHSLQIDMIPAWKYFSC